MGEENGRPVEEQASAAAVAYLLDGAGGARRLEPAEARRWQPADGALWLHLDSGGPEARRWLEEERDLTPGDREALATEPARTRIEVVDSRRVVATVRVLAPESGTLMSFGLTLWPQRAVTLCPGFPPVLRECAQRLQRGEGPRDIAALLLDLLAAAGARLEVAAGALDGQVLDLETMVDKNPRATLATVRVLQRAAAQQRRAAAQRREGLARVRAQGPAWLLEGREDRWRELASRTEHLAEVLDGVLERTRTVYDYVQGRQATILNERLYLLTLISAILLPLTFITGLLGVNVGGIPGTENPWGFFFLCVVLAFLGVVQYVFVRRLQWLPPRSERASAGAK